MAHKVRDDRYKLDPEYREKKKAAARAYHHSHREACIAHLRERYRLNKATYLAKVAAYRTANPAKCAAAVKAAKAKRPEYYRAKYEQWLARRREEVASKRPPKPPKPTPEEARERRKQLGRQYTDRWRARHPARMKELTSRYYAANKEKYRLRWNAWNAKNPALDAARRQRRRARLLAIENTLTREEWQAILESSPACHYCQKPFGETLRPTMDHVIPVSRGGAHSKGNVVAACKSCNSKKKDRERP